MAARSRAIDWICCSASGGRRRGDAVRGQQHGRLVLRSARGPRRLAPSLQSLPACGDEFAGGHPACDRLRRRVAVMLPGRRRIALTSANANTVNARLIHARAAELSLRAGVSLTSVARKVLSTSGAAASVASRISANSAPARGIICRPRRPAIGPGGGNDVGRDRRVVRIVVEPLALQYVAKWNACHPHACVRPARTGTCPAGV